MPPAPSKAAVPDTKYRTCLAAVPGLCSRLWQPGVYWRCLFLVPATNTFLVRRPSPSWSILSNLASRFVLLESLPLSCPTPPGHLNSPTVYWTTAAMADAEHTATWGGFGALRDAGGIWSTTTPSPPAAAPISPRRYLSLPSPCWPPSAFWQPLVAAADASAKSAGIAAIIPSSGWIRERGFRPASLVPGQCGHWDLLLLQAAGKKTRTQPQGRTSGTYEIIFPPRARHGRSPHRMCWQRQHQSDGGACRGHLAVRHLWLLGGDLWKHERTYRKQCWWVWAWRKIKARRNGWARRHPGGNPCACAGTSASRRARRPASCGRAD